MGPAALSILLFLPGFAAGAQSPQGNYGIAALAAQALGGEQGFYGGGVLLEGSRHLRQGRAVEGRLRAGLLVLGSGSKTGPFERPYEARTQGLSVAYDFLFVSRSGGPYAFLGVGLHIFRYRYQMVPGTMAFPDTPARSYDESTLAVAGSAGVGLPLARRLELELRYTLLKHPVVAATGPVGEGFMGDSLDVAPSHAALGLRWRF